MEKDEELACPTCGGWLEDYDFSPLDTAWEFDFNCPHCGNKLHAIDVIDTWNDTRSIQIMPLDGRYKEA